MNNETERENPTTSRQLIDWIHLDLMSKNYPYIYNLIKHAFYFSLTIFIIWFMIKLTENLFPNIPLAIKILVYISEIIIIIHFSKEVLVNIDRR